MADANAFALLSGRIAAALNGDPSSSDIASVMEATEQVRTDLIEEHQVAREVSLDPSADPEAVLNARACASQMEFQIERLASALDHLRPALERAKSREAEAERQTFRLEVLAERDTLAAELRETYPVLAHRLADLLQRIKDNNARLELANRGCRPDEWIDGVEVVVRGLTPTSVYHLLSGVRLPAFDHLDHAMGVMLWPVTTSMPSALIPKELMEASAARGAEIRRIGQVVAAKKREEANASRRRVP